MVGKSVLVTGSSGSLGSCLATVFAEHNYDVILHGRNEKNLSRLQKSIINKGFNCLKVVGDLRSEETLELLFKAAEEQNLSVLVNNAGVHCPGLSLEEISYNKIKEIIEVNLLAPVYLTKKLYPIFKKNLSGTIININSIVGLEQRKIRAIYAASKWGLRGFSKSFREEAEDYNIRVMEVYLCRIKTRSGSGEGIEPKHIAINIYESFKKQEKELIINNE